MDIDATEPPLKPPAHIHLMGICGTGMASLAGMFRERGYRVTGSDNGMYPPMSDLLDELGIPVMKGYAEANLSPRPDLVVVGNVIRRTNPEAAHVERSGIPFLSMPDALDRFFSFARNRIVVTGTHGKTTVSAMIAWILHACNRDPGFMIGGIPENFGRNYRLGDGPDFVIEGDEYDTAYFSKTPKFLHYRPDVGVITSCEFDHADIYSSLDEIKDQFRAFAALIPPTGCLVAHTEDEQVREVVCRSKVQVYSYGMNPGVQWRVHVLEEDASGITVRMEKDGRQAAAGRLPVVGLHNVLNALAASAAAERVGIHPQDSMEALKSFRGVMRRQQILGEKAGILIIDDFAHHPTAVAVTVEGVRRRYPGRRLTAVFEPRTNTSRRAFFQDLYPKSFLGADLTVVRAPRDADAVPGSDRFDSYRMAEAIRAAGKQARAFDNTDEILRFLLENLCPGDVVLIMSNGSFDNLAARLVMSLEDRDA